MSRAPTLLAEPISSSFAPRPLLLVTEGVLDIACLTRLSQIVRTIHPDLPDLQFLADQGRIIFLPAGGGDLAAWIRRLAPLGCPEFHLYDREQNPETDLRQAIVAQINERPHCRACLTRKRSLENYLHPQAVTAALGVTVDMADDTPVADLVARSQPEVQAVWPMLSHRARQRLIYRAKRRLNTEAIHHMTATMLLERDPAEEVLGWFRSIAQLMDRTEP